jgi:peptidoglycan/LPS O-acetylase OafA/YrhL
MLWVLLVVYIGMSLAAGALTAVLMRWLARWSLGWAAAAGVAVALMFWSSSWQPDLPQPYRAGAVFILALALGAFFFIAMRRQGRRMRSAIMAGVIAFTAGVALTYPVETHAVKLDMPRH